MAEEQKNLIETDIVIIGGGAAGFFTAINLAEQRPDLRILIVEKTLLLLAKVQISGGGRCNVTHACFDPQKLTGYYPRGHKELLGPFHIFNTNHTVEWFKKRNIKLKTEADGRMFPVSNTSETIVQCFLQEAQKQNIRIEKKFEVLEIRNLNHKTYEIEGRYAIVRAKAVVLAAGGHAKESQLEYLKTLNLEIVPPVPSLFTFNLPQHPITQLMGLSVAETEIKILETKDVFRGPLLITHWGLSGPAVLKLSAFAARKLHDLEYRYTVRVNWCLEYNEESIRQVLMQIKSEYAYKKANQKPSFAAHLPQRLWEYMLQSAEIKDGDTWQNINNKQMGILSKSLCAMDIPAQGKTTFKEEFVTCGGIKGKEIDFKTMQLKKHPGIFVAGEIINIDGITGGFNFQAAWTTAYIAAKGMADTL